MKKFNIYIYIYMYVYVCVCLQFLMIVALGPLKNFKKTQQ